MRRRIFILLISGFVFLNCKIENKLNSDDSLVAANQNAEVVNVEDSINLNETEFETEIDFNHIQKAIIGTDNIIRLTSSINLDHRIFGYKEPNVNSEKVFLLSIFTNEVENNPYKCKYGAYYETNEMGDLKLKYVESKGGFVQVIILNKGIQLDVFYMEEKWVEIK